MARGSQYPKIYPPKEGLTLSWTFINLIYLKVLYLTFFVMSSLSFATYNFHGSGTDRIEYMKEILQVTDIRLIQEHWLLDSKIFSLEDNINDVHVHGMSGMLIT